MKPIKQKPILSFWSLWNVSFGFLGIQIGYSLQSANTSRILSALGADPEDLPLFWLAAPLAGLIVQPIIGLSSDKTWSRFGRRIPFILLGAIVSALAMFFMPNSEMVVHIMPPVFFGACMLLFMDCAFNVSMQPFRSLVADMVGDKQRTLGYSLQSILINIGAVVGSFLPFIITWLGVSNVPEEGAKVASSLIWSYYIGGSILLLTVLWTTLRVKEYPPKEYNEYNGISEEKGKKEPLMVTLKGSLSTMLQLGVVQFFSWFSLFIMWVYTTQAIAEGIWNTKDANSQAYNDAGDWTGVIFGAYSVFAALFSILMPRIADRFGRKFVYSSALICGALGLISIFFVKDQYLLLLSMLGIGISWAAILAMPYSILSAALPASKMGLCMGLFNATITIPQIVAGITGGLIFTHLVGGNATMMLVVAGISMLFGAGAVWFVKEKQES